MDLVSLNRTRTVDEDTGDVTSGISLSLELDNGEVRNYTLPETSSRYSRAIELGMRVLSPDTSEDDRERAVAGLSAMFNIERRLRNKFKVVESSASGTFKLGTTGVYYNTHKLAKPVEEHIRSLLAEADVTGDNRNWRAFARFVERLYSGDTDAYVRDQLYTWIEAVQSLETGFTLTERGTILGYKGCSSDEDGVPHSLHAGHAFVESLDEDGNLVEDEYKNSRIPNVVGTWVRMPRGEVTNDPAVGCSAGLHIGTREYAESYSRNGILLAVEFDPAHVVSVPTECAAQKIRVERYKVLEASQIYGSTYYDDCVDEYSDYEDEDECPCGYC